MYLTSLVQRELLFDLAERWLRGRPEPADGRLLTLAFLVDPHVTAPVVRGFLRDVAGPERGTLRVEHVRTKDEVRRRIADAWPSLTMHATDLLTEFQRCPERYYPTTPVDLYAFTSGEHDLRAMVRFKSITRIAEKVSRRATRRLAQEIRRRAGSIESSRRARGDDTGDTSLVEAERQVCLDIADGSLCLTRSDLQVNDLLGAKLIAEPAELERLEENVAKHPGVLSLQRSEHRGSYRDTHLVVELACSAPAATAGRLLGQDWSQAVLRGLDPDVVAGAIPGYLDSAARSFFIEVILTTREDLVDSEFGRGIHEERTERQRDDLRAARQLSTNVALIALSMLLVAVGPKTDVPEPPIRLPGRYLPDTVGTILARLFDLDIDRSPLSLPPTDGQLPPASGLEGQRGLWAAGMLERGA